MQLLFVSERTATALAIRLVTLSAWSHVAIADGDHVIEALPRTGVRRCTRANFDSEHGRVRVVDMPTRDDAAGLAFARAQIGKPYDWTAYAWWLMPWRNWQDSSKWECSELAGAALKAAGLWPDVQPDHLSPGLLFDLATAAGAARAPA